MTNHPNRAKVGIIRASNGRTKPDYAVMERLKDGRYCTYMDHEYACGPTRIAYHDDYNAAKRRYEKLEIDAALHR